MSGVVTAALDCLRSYTGSLAWEPLVRLSRGAVLNVLQRIEIGQLQLKEKDGSVRTCGPALEQESSSVPTTELKILCDAFWLRVALFADMVCFPRRPL